MKRRVLILGGTAEARALAAALDERGVHVTSSLAGRVSRPRLPVGEVRLGGFGGPDGLAAALTELGVDVLVDATHPFAARMAASAAEASRLTGVPLLALRRPGWQERPGDDWRRTPSLEAAAAALLKTSVPPDAPATPHDAPAPPLPDAPAPPESSAAPESPVPALLTGSRRVFLTTGRRSLPVFTGIPGVWLLARSVDPPEEPPPPHVRVVLGRGPYTVAGERALIREHRIDVLVTKDSGGTMTTAKLTAAREEGIPVIMVDRPAKPAGVLLAETVEEATAETLRRLAGP